MKIKYFDSKVEFPENQNKRTLLLEGPCQNDCVFCYTGKKRKTEFEFKKEDIFKIIRDGKEKGKTTIHFSGYCEPTLYPSLLESVKYAKDIGYSHICISTNGRKLKNMNFFESLVDAGLDMVFFSIHAPSAELMDSITKSKGSFSDVVSAIKNAATLKKNKDLSVSALVTVTKLNLEYLPKLIFMLSKIGVKHVSASYFEPLGSGKENFGVLCAKKEGRIKYFRKSAAVAKKLGVNFKIKSSIFDISSIGSLNEHGVSIKNDEKTLLAIYSSCKKLETRDILENFGGECLDCSMNFFCGELSKIYMNVIKKKDFDWVDLRQGFPVEPDAINSAKEEVKIILNGQNFEKYIKEIEKSSEKIKSVEFEFCEKEISDKDIENISKIKKMPKVIFSFDSNLEKNMDFLKEKSKIGQIQPWLRIYVSKKNLGFFQTEKFINSASKVIANGAKGIIISQRQMYEGNHAYLALPSEYKKVLQEFVGFCTKNSIGMQIQGMPFCYFNGDESIFSGNFFNISKSYNPSYASLKNKTISNSAMHEIIKNLRYKKKKCSSCRYEKKCAGELKEVIFREKFNAVPFT